MREGPVGAPGIQVLIADQIAHIVEQLAKLTDNSDDIHVCGIARRRGDVIDEVRLRHPDVLLVSSELGAAGTLALSEELATAAPAARILVIASTPPVNGDVPPGAAQVVSADATGAELVAAVRSVYTGGDPAETAAAPPLEPIQELAPRRPRRPGRTRGEIVLIYSGKGGVGKSVVATNLAVTLAGETGAHVALVDLDLQCGDAGVMLRVENHLTSIEDLAAEASSIDGDFLEEVMATGPADVRVLLAPASPELADLVTAANVHAVLRELSKTYDFVVVDAASHLDERTVEVIEMADQILLVTASTVTTVKSTRVTLKLLQSLGIEKDRIALVLNQTRQRVTFPRDEIEQTLRFRMLLQLPFEPRIDDAIDRGHPFVLDEPKSDLSRQFRTLAEYLAPGGDAAAAQERDSAGSRVRVNRRRFSLGRR